MNLNKPPPPKVMLKELPSILAGASLLFLFGVALTGGQVDESAGAASPATAEQTSAPFAEKEGIRNPAENRKSTGREIAFNHTAQ